MKRWPNVEELILSLAACNGILNRNTTSEAVVACGLKAVEADGVCTEDVEALEVWVGTLTEDQKLTLVDGEQQEQADLVARSPTGVGGDRVGSLVDDIYDALSMEALL